MDRGNQERRKNPNPGKDFIQQCREVFEIFDSDRKGTITQYKLSKVMKMYGWRSEHKELQVRDIAILQLKCRALFKREIPILP